MAAIAIVAGGCGTGVTNSFNGVIAEDIVGENTAAARRGRLQSIYTPDDAKCLSRGAQPLWVSLGTRQQVESEAQESGGRSWWEDATAEDETPVSGLLDDGNIEDARVDNAARKLKDNAGYFGVRVRYLRLDADIGPTGRRYYPAVKTDLAFSTEASQQKLSLITQPSPLTSTTQDWNRIAVLNRPLLAPSPYYGGDVNLDMALIGVQSGDVAKSALATLDEISQLTGVSIVSRIAGLADIGKSGIEKILRIDEQPIVKAGVTTSWDGPNLGFWVLAWPQEELAPGLVRRILGELGVASAKYEKGLLAYFQLKGINFCNLKVVRRGADDFKLFLEVDKGELIEDLAASKLQDLAEDLGGYGDADGAIYWDLTGLSWALIEVEGFRQNPNWWQIPNLVDSYKAMMNSFVQDDLEEAARKLTALQEIILISPDLTFGDRLLMAKVAQMRAKDYCDSLAEIKYKSIKSEGCNKFGFGQEEEADASTEGGETPPDDTTTEGGDSPPEAAQAGLNRRDEFAVRPVGLVFGDRRTAEPVIENANAWLSSLPLSPTAFDVSVAFERHAVADFAKAYLAEPGSKPIDRETFLREVKALRRPR